jgi:YVTN family beta-propeller protein
VRGGDVDGGADLYALTCMLFEMLTGELPFRRTTDVATLFAHLEEDPPSAVQLRPELPAAVDDLLARGLAKDPADRQDSCVALVDDARAALGLSAPPARRRSRLLIAGLVAALVAATIVVLLLRPWASEPTAAPAGSLVLIDPNSGAVTARTAVPGYPAAVASAPGGVWMADFRDGVLWRYEPETGALQHISSPGEPRDLAFVGDDVYVASDGPELFSGNISRHNSRSGLREQALTLLACSVGSGDGVLWAAGCPYVQRLNTDGGPLTELATVLVPYADPLRDTNLRMQIRELAIGDGSVWVLGDAVDRRLWRLDMVTGQTQATIDLPFPPRSIAVGNGQVWITDPLNDAVVPITAADNRLLAPVPVGRGAAGVAVGAGAVWVANAIDGTVSRIDPGTRQAVRTIDVGGIPHELSIDDRGVWVTTDAR